MLAHSINAGRVSSSDQLEMDPYNSHIPKPAPVDPWAQVPTKRDRSQP